MNPMAAMAVQAFLKNYPGVADILMKFPNFKQETIQLLLAFGKKLTESPDPEGLLIRVLQDALAVKGKVEVVEVKPLKR
jgi:hypothetical protein